ncbi:MAG: DMT family transporter, partial [Alistipes sp.]|nr:DMT family transporter [Alistipes sp.]
HILAILTSAIWGTTFISSKLLLQEGLSPAAIMILRFVLAYVLMLPFVKGKWFCKSLKDELLMVLLGISGGSLYFLLENTALVYTQASNVAIIIAATPLLTMLTVNLLDRGKGASKRLYGYSLMSLAGVALVILNGNFVLKLNPIGDLLTFGAVVTWVIYSIIIAKVQERYSSWMITRKIFLYGVVTLLPYFFIEPWDVTWEMMSRPMVWGNIAYLGVLASLGCYMTWNIVIKRLGAVDATNYLYINPIVAMITANLLLGERITPLAIAGTALILVGVYLAERKR